MLPALAVAVLLAEPSLAGLGTPAELPPDDYAGQQYIDSKGCLFLRAGPEGNETWVPRVSRDGTPLCDNPPSGRRVPVAEDASDAGEPPRAP
jgi:hypothetical protein